LRILGIESSCDETAAAVVADGGSVLSNVVASQLETHGKYGGVVPELASREHLRAIVPVVRESIERAGCGWDGIGAVAVTEGPGLVGSLLVGISFAKAVSMARKIPLIAVNHIEGHIHAVLLEARQQGEPVEFPALALVVSGGHTHLFAVASPGEYSLLGRTRDDAAGEAYDKVAKLLGYPYPGGPIIDQLAPHGNPKAVAFTRARMKGNRLDMSFSGLKTAVLRWFEARDLEEDVRARRELTLSNPQASVDDWLRLTPRETLDMLASFQATVIDELLSRVAIAAEQTDARAVIVSGGVASNRGLRAASQSGDLSCPVYFPTPTLSTDNAVMIAAAAFEKYRRGKFSGLDLKAKANLRLA